MGFHFINGGLLDANLDPTKPEALVYEPDKHGKLHLVALEFVTFKDDWDAAHPGVWPSLFGEDFMFTPDHNRYDIPAFYSLHVWLWKSNPAGLFSRSTRTSRATGRWRPAARRRRRSPRRRSSPQPAASSSTARSGDRPRSLRSSH